MAVIYLLTKKVVSDQITQNTVYVLPDISNKVWLGEPIALYRYIHMSEQYEGFRIIITSEDWYTTHKQLFRYVEHQALLPALSAF